MTQLEGDRRPTQEDLGIRSGISANYPGTPSLPQRSVSGDYYFEHGTHIVRPVISEKVEPVTKHLS